MSMDNDHGQSAGAGQDGLIRADASKLTEARGIYRAVRRHKTWDLRNGVLPPTADTSTRRSLQAESAARVYPQRGDSPPATAADSCKSPLRWGVARTACVATVLVAMTLTGCSTGVDATGVSASEGSAPVSAPRDSGGTDRIDANAAAATSSPLASSSASTPAKSTTKTEKAKEKATRKTSRPSKASGSSGTTAAPSSPAVSDPQPRPEKGDKAPADPAPVVGFDPGKTGAPQVNRGQSANRQSRVAAEAAGFGAAVNYPDGVQATTGKFHRGTVKQEGAGYITGAAYVVMDLEIRAAAERELDLSHVVVTLRFGDEELVAAPLYGETETRDFGGTVDAGDLQTATYAFLLPDDVGTATLYIDIDGQHEPATVQGKIP